MRIFVFIMSVVIIEVAAFSASAYYPVNTNASIYHEPTYIAANF